MKPQELLFLSTLCLLLYDASYAQHGFRPRQEYTFWLEGRTVAGFPELGGSQHAGVHYRGAVKVQRDTVNSILLKFHDMKYRKIHENLPEGWWAEVQHSPESYNELPITSSTVSVKLGRQNVEHVAVKKGLHKWEINFIQGVAYQLYASAPTATKPRSTQANTSYKTKEYSLFGKCEISFEITKVPRAIALAHDNLFPNAHICGSRNFYEIFKTRNFSNCQNDPEYHFGLPYSKRCPPGGNECEDFWNRASVTRLSGCGDRSDFEILQSETNTRVIAKLHLHNGTEASVSSYISLNLKSVKPIGRHLVAPSDPDVYVDLKFQHVPFKDTNAEDVLYDGSSSEENDDFDEVTKKPLLKSKAKSKKKNMTIGHLTSTLPPPLYKNPLLNMETPPVQPLSPFFLQIRENDASFNRIQKLRELITDASNELEVPKSISARMTLEKVVSAVKLCRTMTYIDLSKTSAIISLQAQSNRMLLTERRLLRDILVMCGTGPSFRILKGWLDNRDLIGEEASGVVAAMPSHLQSPDSHIITEFYSLARLLVSREDTQLKSTAILALSNLLRIACVETGARDARYFTATFHGRCKPEDMVTYMSWFVSGARSEGPLRRVYLTALGNTGNVTALVILRAVAQDTSLSIYIRTTAVYSMKYQVMNSPREASYVLFSLYRDVGLPVPVRIAAVSLLFYTKPTLATFQRIAVSTWYDPIPAVAAFVRSSLRSLSKVKDPTYQTLTRYAGMALPLSRPLSLGLHKPYNVLWSRVTSELQEVVLTQLCYDTSLDASNLYFRYTQRHGGLSRNVIEAEFFAANLDLFLTKLREILYPSDDITIYRPAIKDLPRSTRWIRDKLGIDERTLPKFEGDFHFIWDKLHERMFPMDKQVFVDIVRGGRQLIENMKNGHIYNYQKANLKSISIYVITELGFPVNFDIHVPWALRINTNSKIILEEKKLEMEIIGVYTSQLMSGVSFYTDWDKTIHMAASHGITVINCPPVMMTVGLLTDNRALELDFKSLEPSTDNVIFHHSTTPFTSQQDVLNVYHNLVSTASVVRNKKNIQKSTSVLPNININYTTETTNDSPVTWFKNAISIQGFCMISPSLEASSLEVQMDKFDSMNFQFTLDYATVNNKKVIVPTSTEKIINSKEDASTEASTPRSPSSTTNVLEKNRETSTKVYVPDGVIEDDSGNSLTLVRETLFDALYNSTNRTTTTSSSTVTSTVTEKLTTTTTAAAATTTATITTTTAEDDTRLAGGFNASYIDPFTKGENESQARYILDEMLAGMNNGRAYVVGMHVKENGDGVRSCDLYWAQASSGSVLEDRYAVFYQSKQPQEKITQLKVTSRFLTPMILVLKLEDAIKSNVSASLNTDIIYSFNNTDYKFNIKTSMGRNPETTESLKDSECMAHDKKPETDPSPRCLHRAVASMYVDRYNVTLIYNEEAKELGPRAMQSFNHIRYWLMQYITDDNQYLQYYSTPANTILGVLSLSPQQDAVDAWIRSGNMETEFKKVPVNVIVSNLLRVHPGVSYAQRLKEESYCAQIGDRWITFDGLEYNYNLTSCWTVLVKDCSCLSHISIVARAIDNETDVEINLDNYKIINLQRGLNILVNGEPVQFDNNTAEIRDEAGTVIARITKTGVPENIVGVRMPEHGFNLLYTDNSILIMVQDITRNRVCGLCGDNSGDLSNDLANPRGTLERSAQTFAASYSLNDGTCGAENY